MINEIKNIKGRITELLKNYPHLRDSDNKLIANIWHRQIGKDKAKDFSAFDFLTEFANGKLILPESVRRTRQKIQEQNIELRGKSYVARQKKGKEFKNQINKI